MSRKILLMVSTTMTLATMTLSPNAAFAQFPPPPLAGPPPIAAGGPPPLPAGGPPALAGRLPVGPVGPPRAGVGGLAPRLGAEPAPRGALAAAERAGVDGRGGPAVAGAVRGTPVTYNRFGGYGRYGETSRGHLASHAAGAYAAGATAGYAYGGSRYGYSSDSDCYYVYRRYRRILVCD